MKKSVGAVVIIVSLLPQMGLAASTAVSQTISPGLLTLGSSSGVTLSSATLNAAGNSTTVGTLGAVTVTDSRGSGAGWSATATSTNFSKLGAPVRTAGGSPGSLTSSGTYTGTTSGTYTVTITTGGATGTAMFTVSGLETQGATVLSASTAIGTKGISINSTGGPFSPGDQWTVSVDVLPVSGFTISPAAITGATGSMTGVAPGSSHTFSDGSDPATLMIATSGNGMGQYVETPNLAMIIPPSAKVGTYTAIVTETVN